MEINVHTTIRIFSYKLFSLLMILTVSITFNIKYQILGIFTLKKIKKNFYHVCSLFRHQ